jgi:hypothetical protein
MALFDPAYWSDKVRRTLQRYDEPLLRRVASRLFKPRNQWPREELVERSVATLSNAPVVDRHLARLGTSPRKLLALLGHSRQPRWKLGGLLELLAALGHAEGVQPALELLEDGLLYPELAEGEERDTSRSRLKNIEQWLGHAGAVGYTVFAHPDVTARALGVDLGLPDCPGLTSTPDAEGIHEADGLEWPLRLAVLWQRVTADPLRQTQQGQFFKRDLDRLRSDPVLNGTPAQNIGETPDAGPLAVELGKIEGILAKADGQLRTGAFPAAWDRGLNAALESMFAALPHLETWNPKDGWQEQGSGGHQPPVTAGNPYPSAYLLSLLLLGRLPDSAWAPPEAVASWIAEHHPYWQGLGLRRQESGVRKATEKGVRGPGSGVRNASDTMSSGTRGPWPLTPEVLALTTFMLGSAFQMRLLQAAKDKNGGWLVRLSALGRWLLGLAGPPADVTGYPKTILVQPTLEIVVYRQGLTPGLVAMLSQFAAWKNLGAACTLQMQPETVYRALETGGTFEMIVQTLERHGMRPIPPAVVQSLRTWANKRERLSVYASAALFEFTGAEELNQALARGLPGVRISERLTVVPNEDLIDYRHYRLTGTRDYGLPPDQCVEVERDGVTLTIDSARADLLLETELRRFAEPLGHVGMNGRSQYRVTPASLAAGGQNGLDLRDVENWFVQRTGRPVSPAVRLLLTGALIPPLEARRQLVLHVETPEVADGLQQWPDTCQFVRERLGPTALTIAEEDLEMLREQLQRLGMGVRIGLRQ